MQRDDMRESPRRRYGPESDSDPRDAPIERYGNEEDQYSREYRRVYAEENLPNRLRDDSPYNRAGYEPEAGRPGGRENVDLQGGRGQNQGQHQHQPQYPGPGQSQQRGRDQGNAQRRSGSDRDPYGQSAYQQLASPYDDENAIGPWYGGDTGMGDPGTSERGRQPQGQQGGWNAGQSGRQQESTRGGQGQYGGGQGGYRQDDRFSSRQASSFDDGQRGRFSSGQQPQQAGGQRDWQQRDQHDPQHGPFTGRGPRNYQRSDERIRDDVCELLTRHGGIDASQMEVDVQRGVVTLRGSADSGRIRRMTEELVEDLAGVRDVQNDLRVNQRAGNTGTAGTGGQAMGDSAAMAGHPPGSGAHQGEQASVPAYGTGVASTSGVSTRTGPGEPGISAGAGRSQHGNPWQVRETMDVVGADGKKVGTVKMVAGTDFILDRPMARDLHVPFSAVRTVDGERVMLACRAEEVDQQNWPASDLTGTGTGSTGSNTGERPASR